ncbi:hypothetical protein CAOG_010142 [Capsaspora owczarzaki ATCC 30864]|uniref:Uncharacterized protein n=1 Tax=Capsaspora owczarzaki (strain ATCC 30864) TaxID=595528 RepID=A0A0D2URG0_CAPO3|nr:hypothetical protein CAOG_009416 [Capsaspora owczarzaki ATCC 30864]KJE97571.1 hypothetical protein CAOG_010142 [Capsaspora owczarzaki ATCC 30864]
MTDRARRRLHASTLLGDLTTLVHLAAGGAREACYLEHDSDQAARDRVDLHFLRPPQHQRPSARVHLTITDHIQPTSGGPH